MKKKVFIVLLLFLGLRLGLNAELLSQIGTVDMDAIAKLKGHWLVEGSQYYLSFTDQYACKIDGLTYFYYTRSNAHTSYPWVYTVVRSKKTNQLYFARGSYQGLRFLGSTSKMEFDDKDHITVYSSTNSRKVYFFANRFSPEVKKIKRH